MSSTQVDAALSDAPVREGYPDHRRMVRFDWSDTPLHWVPEDPFSTHMVNVLHLLLPAGERWFIGVVTEAAPFVTDPEVARAIQPFVQQESWHAWAHQMVLDKLAGQGIDSEPFTSALDRWFARTGSPKPSWPAPLQRWWLHRRLADVAAIEHFTAVLGQWVIQNRGLDFAGADPEMLDLLRWHGAEEVEHRALVFDVFEDLSGSYLIRSLAMLFTAPSLLAWWLRGVRYLMANDPTHPPAPRWRDWLRAARQYRVPGPWMLIVTTPLRYLRPSHHPSREATNDLAKDYLAQSPAAQRARAAASDGQG
ncbi:MAG TPA: metal-dependent hydrolase [Acidimicrobiales bacterium]|nr:metal-dependent hydrolase [Acidimicrobiales bacterium]